MMKFKRLFFSALLLIFTVVSYTFAANPAPVWFAPSDVKINQELTINTFLLNSSAQDVVFEVSFSVLDKEIGSTTLTIPKDTGKTVSTKWTMPKDRSTVIVNIKTAKDKDGKRIASLEGQIGSLVLGGVEAIDVSSVKITNLNLAKYLEPIEKLRIEKAEHYATLRDTTKAKAISTGVKDIAELMVPSGPAVDGNVEDPKDQNKALDYATYIFAIAMASFFGHQILFYIASILIVFFLIRFIFRIF